MDLADTHHQDLQVVPKGRAGLWCDRLNEKRPKAREAVAQCDLLGERVGGHNQASPGMTQESGGSIGMDGNTEQTLTGMNGSVELKRCWKRRP